MRSGERRKISEGPDGEEHQPNEEKGCERKDSIDHFPLGDQVHEITGDQKGFAAGDEKGDADVYGAVAEGNVRRAHSNERAEQQGVKNEQITTDVMAEVIRMLLVHN